MLRPAPFDSAVPQNGYRWWYLDATAPGSDQALVIIVFVGSVFSPYYHRARHKGLGDPENFCAINIGLYGPGGRKRWAMTERRAGSITRSPDEYAIGPSRVRWRQGRLLFDIDERCAPFGQRLRGRVSVEPQVTHPGVYLLDAQQRHQWTPWSPQARVEVAFEQPGVSWQGHGYVDGNAGSEPLEAAFRSWDWSRAARPDGTLLHYDVLRRDGSRQLLARLIDQHGNAHELSPETIQPLPRAGWGVARKPRSACALSLRSCLEDTPFYTRNLLTANNGEQEFEVVHESLSMERFEQGWVRCLLPFRMPREPRARPRGKDLP